MRFSFKLNQNLSKLGAKFINLRFGGISFTLPTVVTRVFSKLNNKFDLTKMRDFKVSHPNLGIANNVYNEALESVESNVRWMETNLKSITDFLANLPKDRMNIDLIE